MKTREKLQGSVQKRRRSKNNKMCKEKCDNGSIIHNFTQYDVPVELSKFLEDGLGNVPEITRDVEEVTGEVEKEIKIACKNLFLTIVGSYPRFISFNVSVDAFIQNLIILAPNFEKPVFSLISIRENYLTRLPFFIENLKKAGKKENCKIEQIIALIPRNCILSPSDKNLGVCMLPPLWHDKEYKSQVLKDGYEIQDISEAKCLSIMQQNIKIFRDSLFEDQKIMLSSHWPKISISKPRIGVLKLVPKIHKLVGPFTSESWAELKSRPIRGAESDPMKIPSKALYSLLQKMLKDFSRTFPVLN